MPRHLDIQDRGSAFNESLSSPLGQIHAIADRLDRDRATGIDDAWVVRAAPPPPRLAGRTDPGAASGDRPTAWPRWFRHDLIGADAPVLYLLKSSSVAGIATALADSRGRGVFCNEAEAWSSRWQKGVQPDVPLWLSTSFGGLPFDPATGAEAAAILRHALSSRSRSGEASRVYVSAHDRLGIERPLSPRQVADAVQGMYRFRDRAGGGQAPGVRLLGAGHALANVLAAADLLWTDWGIASEVWSCPSYTRLARDAEARGRAAHVHACLAGSEAPVVAVTGYPMHIADQIRAFAGPRFSALGAEWAPRSAFAPSAEWITATALKSLSEDGAVPVAWLLDALRRYALIPTG
jgi:hypothetical protein